MSLALHHLMVSEMRPVGLTRDIRHNGRIKGEYNMNPLFWFIWLNERFAGTLRPTRRRPLLRVIEGGRKDGAPRPMKLDRQLSLARRNAISAQPSQSHAWSD